MGEAVLHFIRHLPPTAAAHKVVYGREEIELDTTSPEVVQRLEHLAQVLPCHGKTRVEITPTPRTRKTFDMLCDINPAFKDLPINDDSTAFVEQNWGRFTGLQKDLITVQHELEEAWRHYHADPINVKTPDGECFTDLFNRVGVGMDEIAAQALADDDYEDVLVFGHAGTSRSALAFALQTPPPLHLTGVVFSPLSHLVLAARMHRGTPGWQLRGLSQGILPPRA